MNLPPTFSPEIINVHANIRMGLGGAPTCRHCCNFRPKCSCRCDSCHKTLPDCKCPADRSLSAASAQHQPPEYDSDPHIRMIMMAYHDRESHQSWIDALAARETIRRMEGGPSPYAKAVQPFVRALVKHSMARLIASAGLTEHIEPRTPLLARPPRLHTPLTVAKSQAARDAPFVRKQQLAAYHLLPELIAGLTLFSDTWRSSTTPVTRQTGTPESFSSFLFAATEAAQRVLRQPKFWGGVTDGVGMWREAPADEDGRQVPSPYLLALALQPSRRGSPSGPNAWLDRFLHARTQFRIAVERVLFHPYVVHATQDDAPAPQPVPPLSDFPLQLVADLTALKMEYAALFALCVCPLSLPVHDFSSDGRQPDSKWFAAAGGFRLWTSDTRHEHLSDPHGLQGKLRGISELRFVGRTLADLPGHFPDVEGHISTTLARLRAKQINALAHTISDAKQSPFRDPDERHPDLDDAFYSTIARLQESTWSAAHDPVRVRRSEDARAAETQRALALMQEKLREDEWYNGPLTGGRTLRVSAVLDEHKKHAKTRPASGRFELLEAGPSEDSTREALEDMRLADNLQADEDLLQAVMAASAAAHAGPSKDDALEAGSAGPSGAAHATTSRSVPDQRAVHRQRMAAVTLAQVQQLSSNDTNVALDVYGVKIPESWGIRVPERKQLLRALLSNKTVEQVIQAFAEQDVPLTHTGEGQWSVNRKRRS